MIAPNPNDPRLADLRAAATAVVRELDRAMGVAAEGRGALGMDRMFAILCGEATH